MSVRLPNGTTFAIAASYGPDKAFTAITNAKPAKLSSVAHGFAKGAILEVSSGWSRLDGRVARADAVTADAFALEGIDTTDTGAYPAGTGIGSARLVVAFQQISQVLQSAASGGDQQFYNYSFLEDTGDEKQIPTIRSARSYTLTIADDPALAHYALLEAADEDREPRAVQMKLPGGSPIYFRAYVSFSKVPTTTKNEAMAITVTLSLTGEVTRYAGA
ncbi:phage tail protein [Ralstonia pseudosolanacearum]|uniref:phage tail protein n=1 Tax=Ralstonia pseudosolanacearum TaxID=1310165 RepID=UPI00090B604A|nr:phage tail protein [Ralstonia pseudosolanacearum]AUS42543.1 phage tail protein [Ralstonia solanacearum]API74699.1 phage tail protein [Ralstonia pseudosolanacearum]MCK4127101.1 phage tail protein [Ralstonia pseudosolanacearum]QKL56818.1 phage tail protein [Ralstonia solanacearum]QKM32870.1 phage tail protein [Ralstonia solanacearum]